MLENHKLRTINTRIAFIMLVSLFAGRALSQQSQEPLPVPDDAAQNAALVLINEAYKPDFEQAKTPEQQIAIARKMLQQGTDIKNDTASRYVLLRIAHDTAGKAGDVQTAFRAIDAMQGSFQIEALRLKATVIADAAKALRAAEVQQQIIQPTLALLQDAIRVDEYELAKSLSEIALASARRAKDFELIKQFVRRKEELDDLAASYAESLAAREVLNDNPTDPAANLAVGRFYCLAKGDWVNGIPMLALGNDDELQALAAQELAPPEDVLALGDAWWELAEQQEEFAALRIRLHGVHWYKKALPSLSGLSKAKIEKRIGDAATIDLVVEPREVARYKTIDLGTTRIPLLQPGTAYLGGGLWRGDWRIEGEELVQRRPGESKLHFGDPNWTDYDLQVQVMTHRGTKGNNGAAVCFRVMATTSRYCLDIGRFAGGWTDLSLLTMGKWSRIGRPLLIQHEHGRWYDVKIELRGPSIRCFVDGRQLFDRTDATFSNGMVGFETMESSLRLKELTVTAPDGTMLWEGFPDVSKL